MCIYACTSVCDTPENYIKNVLPLREVSTHLSILYVINPKMLHELETKAILSGTTVFQDDSDFHTRLQGLKLS